MQLWTDYEGVTIDGAFPLQKLLLPEGRSAFFSTAGANGEPTVVRLIECHFDEEEILARWRCVEALNHPNFLKFEHYGQIELDSSPVVYAVFEKVDANLAGVLDQGHLSFEDVAQLGTSLVSALDVLHTHGFVHEHVEPRNIFAVGDVVKLRSDCIRETPEGAEGSAAKQSEVRDLATVLLQALTGRQSLEGVPDSALPAPFGQIIRNGLNGTWGLGHIRAALEGQFGPTARKATKAVNGVVKPAVAEQKTANGAMANGAAKSNGAVKPEMANGVAKPSATNGSPATAAANGVVKPAAAEPKAANGGMANGAAKSNGVVKPEMENVVVQPAVAAQTGANGAMADGVVKPSERPEAQLPLPLASHERQKSEDEKAADEELEFRPATARGEVWGRKDLWSRMEDWLQERNFSLRSRWLGAVGIAAVCLLLSIWGFVHAWNAHGHKGAQAAGVVSQPAAQSAKQLSTHPAPGGAAARLPGVSHSASAGSRADWRVIPFTYNRRADAEKKVSSIGRKHPELQPAVFTPSGHAPYLVSIGGVMDRGTAYALARRARSLGLPHDTYAQNYSR